ncbi:hypothetical protein [Desulfoferula mesophila]|uniref:hypothetical protein n=1 Tax=Desulfoferula mesophila TaxID=3058419 RepID=UPI0030D51E83
MVHLSGAGHGQITKVRKIKPVTVDKYLKGQKRFRHLFAGEQGAELVAKLQQMADANIAKYGLISQGGGQ